jgi:hypothetical protein
LLCNHYLSTSIHTSAYITYPLGPMITTVLRRQPKVVLIFGMGRNIRDGQQYTSSSKDRPPESDGLGLITKYIHQWSMALQHRADNLALARGLVFSRLGSHINRVSGYEAIEALKKNVVEQGEYMNPILMYGTFN